MNSEPIQDVTDVGKVMPATNNDFHDRLGVNRKSEKKDKEDKRRRPAPGAVEDLIDHSHDEDDDQPLVVLEEQHDDEIPGIDLLL